MSVAISQEQIKAIKPLNIIAGIVLIIAIIPILPYAYYQLLRWFVCGVAVYNSYLSHKLKDTKLTWTFGIIAVLFNPIAPIFLSRGVWFFIDIVVAIMFFNSINKISRKLTN